MSPSNQSHGFGTNSSQSSKYRSGTAKRSIPGQVLRICVCLESVMHVSRQRDCLHWTRVCFWLNCRSCRLVSSNRHVCLSLRLGTPKRTAMGSVRGTHQQGCVVDEKAARGILHRVRDTSSHIPSRSRTLETKLATAPFVIRGPPVLPVSVARQHQPQIESEGCARGAMRSHRLPYTN